MLDVFLKSSLHVPGHLFLICGSVMFVQPPAEAPCALMLKVLRQRNVIAGLLKLFGCKAKDAGSLPQIVQVLFCFWTKRLSAKGIYTSRAFHSN